LGTGTETVAVSNICEPEQKKPSLSVSEQLHDQVRARTNSWNTRTSGPSQGAARCMRMFQALFCFLLPNRYHHGVAASHATQ
jgi:hypothetical protein